MDLTSTVQRLTKVDYLDGLGIAIGSREVSLVHLSKRVLYVALRHARTVPLPESGRERLEAYEQAVGQFLRDISHAGSRSPLPLASCGERQPPHGAGNGARIAEAGH